MKTILRTYRFRMFPDSEQRQILARHFGSVRFIYNHFLARRKEEYEKTGKCSSYKELSGELKVLKKTEEYSWLKEIKQPEPPAGTDAHG